MEILKTKGRTYTNLNGYHQIEQTYSDQTVTDSFRVLRKLNSSKDAGGCCYDWYEIDRHCRSIDKSSAIELEIRKNNCNAENAICELDECHEKRINILEDALCELDEELNGGRVNE